MEMRGGEARNKLEQADPEPQAKAPCERSAPRSPVNLRERTPAPP